MSAEKFANARVHEWLTPDLDAVAASMHTTRLQLNSAALWWFCRRLTPEERAHLLGEYVKVQALGGADASPVTAEPVVPTPGSSAARARRKKTGETG